MKIISPLILSLSPTKTPHHLNLILLLPNQSLLFKKIFKKKESTFPINKSKNISQRRKLNIAIALILLIALSVSAYFGFKKNKSLDNQAKFDQISAQIEQKLKNAEAVKKLKFKKC